MKTYYCDDCELKISLHDCYEPMTECPRCESESVRAGDRIDKLLELVEKLADIVEKLTK